MPDLICAVATPAGRGAIATVMLAGERAVGIVEAMFKPASGRPLASYATGSVVFGRFVFADGACEELVVGLPRDGQLEIHCHGGRAAVTAICDSLVAQGARLADSALYARETESDPLRAAALVALGEAKTAQAAAILLDQYRGRLADALIHVAEVLMANDAETAAAKLEELLSRREVGLHLTNPWKVVLAGPPNAGKSSLMNALLGFQRSIVFPEPGTTRDVLSGLTAIAGWPVELVDTAGLRQTGDPLEAAGVNRARWELAAADLVVFVADLTAAWDGTLFQEVSQVILRAHRERSPLMLIVHNKSDLTGSLTPPARRIAMPDRPSGITVSAKTGEGMAELCQRISEVLVPSAPPKGSAVPFTEEEVHRLKDVLAMVRENESLQALAVIEQLLGNRQRQA
jgi:tRNA modification GTPase